MKNHMLDKEMEEAIWKTYPEFPFIEANQFGEIRRVDRIVEYKDGRKQLVKGHILKQYLSNSGYVFVRISSNGKTVSRFVHRIVATCFIPNPNDYPEVNHIDNNPKNNSVSNLEWCTRKYNDAYKKNFGTSQADVSGCHVFAVDLKTGKVIRFETQAEAACQLGIDQRSVNGVVNGRQNTADGCWFTEDESEITEEKIQEVGAKMRFLGGVVAINLDTFNIYIFESQREAGRQLGIDNSAISKVTRGKIDMAKDFWFCRVDEYTVEKVRVKFGDEIADKVEKLIRIS